MDFEEELTKIYTEIMKLKLQYQQQKQQQMYYQDILDGIIVL